MARPKDLLAEVEAGALDSSTELAAVLRKCIALGGLTGSEGLRAWASLELKGYGGDDELPEYRRVPAPLKLDGVTVTAQVSGQTVPLTLMPDVARELLTSPVPFGQPVAELESLVRTKATKGVVELGPPGSGELVALMNYELSKGDQGSLYGAPRSPSQHIDRIYWQVSLTSVTGILDVIRTTLVELVAEMRAGTPVGQALPSRDVAEQAVAVAVHGNRNRVVINQVGSNNEGAVAAGNSGSIGSGSPESPSRRVMWWIAGIVGLLSTAVGIWSQVR